MTGESCETVAADCPVGNSSSVLQGNNPALFGCVETWEADKQNGVSFQCKCRMFNTCITHGPCLFFHSPACLMLLN